MDRLRILEDWYKLGSGKSGNWGHAGRPGKRGGSVPRSVAMSIRTGRDWKKRQAAKGEAFGSSKVSSSAPLGLRERGVNESIILEFKDGTKGIFKQEDMAIGSAESEILAYELSKSLGWDLVPETIPYTHEGQNGSLQKWVDEAETAYTYIGPGLTGLGDSLKPDGPKYQKDFDRMKVLDAMLNNRDRHSGNWLVGEDRLWAIDNGGAFGAGAGAGGKKNMSPTNYRPLTLAYLNVSPQVIGEVKTWAGTRAATAYLQQVSVTLGTGYARKLEGGLP